MRRALALLLLIAVGSRAGDDRIKALVERFRNGDAVERRAARDALLRVGRDAWPYFRDLLNADDPDVRRRARRIWARIVSRTDGRWGVPAMDSDYDPATGRPLLVRDRKTGLLLVLLKPGTVEVKGRVVELKKPIYMSIHEVTQEAYGRGREDVVFFHSRERGALPMADLARADIAAFCRATKFRLATRMEWEYAFFAGAPNEAPKEKRRVKAGSTPPNGLGIHEMRGNLAEWCQGGLLMGGSFLDDKLVVHAAAAARGKHIGFRVVREP